MNSKRDKAPAEQRRRMGDFLLVGVREAAAAVQRRPWAKPLGVAGAGNCDGERAGRWRRKAKLAERSAAAGRLAFALGGG